MPPYTSHGDIQGDIWISSFIDKSLRYFSTPFTYKLKFLEEKLSSETEKTDSIDAASVESQGRGRGREAVRSLKEVRRIGNWTELAFEKFFPGLFEFEDKLNLIN